MQEGPRLCPYGSKFRFQRPQDLLEKYLELPPPWVVSPARYLSISWRMGYGEGYLIDWFEWWRGTSWSRFQRLDYFLRWPQSFEWIDWTLSRILGLRHLNQKSREDRACLALYLEAELRALCPLAPYQEDFLGVLAPEDLEAKYGSLPPPWFHLDLGPESLAWRTQGGKKILDDWFLWWRGTPRDHGARQRYFQSWDRPAAWLDFVVLELGEPPARGSREARAWRDFATEVQQGVRPWLGSLEA